MLLRRMISANLALSFSLVVGDFITFAISLLRRRMMAGGVPDGAATLNVRSRRTVREPACLALSQRYQGGQRFRGHRGPQKGAGPLLDSQAQLAGHRARAATGWRHGRMTDPILPS